MEATYGLVSLLPVTVVIISAIITRRALEPLLLGALVGFFILAKENFVVAYLGALYAELGTSAYFIIIFGLFGIYIRLLEESKAISGFTNWGLKFAKNKKKTALLTWVMGMVLFLDNYFSILGAGVSNKEIADKNKMSREFYTYSVNMVACATCVLIPLSLWGVFMSGQIETTLGLQTGAGIGVIAKSIPFMFFAFISPIMVLLYQFKIVPLFGPMKAAEIRVETTGKLLPYDDVDAVASVDAEESEKGNIVNFIIPMVALIVVTLITSDLLYGLLVGIACCYVMYIGQKLIKPEHAFDIIPAGFQDMFIVTAIVISAFVLQQANDQLGLATFVVSSVEPYMNAGLLPAIAFVLLMILGFVTGSFWGMMAVCFPIILPLADSLGTNMYMAIGAVVAGAAAGSSTCFYGDSATLICGVTKLKNIDYARTALPLCIPPIIISIIAYLIAGFIF
ncbi:MAG: Na+/H+ antiporter NhaC family protein [Anaerovorax sp.]